jgi:hypothetical protein
MAIRRGGPPRPGPSPQGVKAKAKPRSKSTPASPFTDHDASEEPHRERAVRFSPSATEAVSATSQGRALLQLSTEIAKLDRELGKLLELFAASDSEARLWARLAEHRQRLDDARRRWNRVRKRRTELSKLFRDAPLDRNLGALAVGIDRVASEGERFDRLSGELSALLDAAEGCGPRRLAAVKGGRSHRAEPQNSEPPGALLAELAAAMIDLIRAGDPEG